MYSAAFLSKLCKFFYMYICIFVGWARLSPKDCGNLNKGQTAYKSKYLCMCASIFAQMCRCTSQADDKEAVAASQIIVHFNRHAQNLLPTTRSLHNKPTVNTYNLSANKSFYVHMHIHTYVSMCGLLKY